MGRVEITVKNPRVKEVQDWSTFKRGKVFIFLDSGAAEIMLIVDDAEAFIKELMTKYANRVDPWRSLNREEAEKK